MKLPDGEELTEARKNTLKRGYDHYWRSHDKESEWVNFCPICKSKEEERIKEEIE